MTDERVSEARDEVPLKETWKDLRSRIDDRILRACLPADVQAVRSTA